jgi:hypothetical protein
MMQILHFASVFITKGDILHIILRQPPLRYKMLVFQENLKWEVHCTSDGSSNDFDSKLQVSQQMF